MPFDPDKLAGLVTGDKLSNPSNYAVVTISEGARMIDGDVVEYGDSDAYGHRKLGGVGQVTADLIKRLTGENVLYQQLGYMMRSGAPDAFDRLVAANYGALAVDLAVRGITGRMVALREGRYTHVAADMPAARREAGRRGRVLRHRRLQTQGCPCSGQTHVLVLARSTHAQV